MTTKLKTSAVVFQGLEAGLRMFRWVVVILLVLFCFSGVQKVEPGNVGLLLRFGQLQGATPGEQVRQPGLLMALPFPVDRVVQVPVKEEGEVLVDEVWHEITQTPTSDDIDPVLEGYCLTGDQNVVQARLVAKYRITDPIAFELFAGQEDREAILRDVVVTALTHTVAGWGVDEVRQYQRPDPLREGSVESLEESVRRRAQARLDALGAGPDFPGCGMTISALEFKDVNPPRHVILEFQRAYSAQIDKMAATQKAIGDASQMITQAESNKTKMVQDALAYGSTIEGQARAEVAEFKDLYEEYRKSPALVWQRILIETAEKIYENVGEKRFVAPGVQVFLDGEEKP